MQYSTYDGGAVDYSYAQASVRPKVKPKQTEVYVDGYYAGIVDDFDGMFQRLYMPPGQHEIVLRLDGYQTHRQTLHVNSGSTVKLHHDMKPLGPGEKTPPPPEPPADKPRFEGGAATVPTPEREDTPPPPREAPAVPPAVPQPEPSRERAPQSVRIRPQGHFGLLAIQVQPADAQVFIDGELWGSLAGLNGLSIHLTAGPHRLELKKDGYAAFSTDVTIRQGETTRLNVKLDGIEL
jgi:hypothetical protein